MKFHRFAVTLLLAALLPSLSAVTVKSAVSADKKDCARLIDNNTEDRSVWSNKGSIHTLEFTLEKAEKLHSVIIYPGIRGNAPFASTEAGPKEIKIFGWQNGKYIRLTDKEVIILPRDHQNPMDEFSAEIQLLPLDVEKVKIEILSSHDSGFRMNSLDVALPPEKRSVNIREIVFKSVAERQREDAAYAQFTAEIKAFFAEYDKFAARQDSVSEAVTSAWGERAELLRKLSLGRKNITLATRHYEYLKKQLAPYFSIKNGADFAKNNYSMSVRISGDASIVVPVSFPLNFDILDKLFAKKLSRFNVAVEAVYTDGRTNLIRSRVDNLTPSRANLVWKTEKNIQTYKITFTPYRDGEKPFRKTLIGDGDQLTVNRDIVTVPPTNFWNVRFHDLLGDGTKQLIAGRWTDYAHVYRNLGTDEKPKYHESEHYVILDSFDMPVGTTDHHGLAFSLTECADFDNDGKLDITLQRTYDTTPIFLHNRSKEKGRLDFAEAVTIESLPRFYRYTFGDLNGDGLADALGTRMRKEKTEVIYAVNLGLNDSGVPKFSKVQKLNLNMPDSKESARKVHYYKASPYLIDLNNDGLLDLSMSLPPETFVLFNKGDKKNFKFDNPQMVKHLNGKPFTNVFYYPNISWADINGDGLCDLFARTAGRTWLSKGSVLTISDTPTPLKNLEKQQLLSDVYIGLANFQIFDVDGDGKLEFCQLNNNYELVMYKLEADGKFNFFKKIPLEGKNFQRFGCMDHSEYGVFYTQMLMYDFDGDKKLDMLFNNEHNFTFGYYSLYLDNGKGAYSEEFQVTPKLDRRHIVTVDSPKGKALQVTPDNNVDFLSFETEGVLDLEAGKIEFNFASSRNTNTRMGRTLFSSTFWDKKLYTNATQLYETYRKCSDVGEFLNRNPGFALVQLPNGKIRCQIGNKYLETKKPFDLKANVYHKFAVVWGADGVKLFIDDKKVAESAEKLQSIAERFHIGSMAALSLQAHREYPDRVKTNLPYDVSTPAWGYFEDISFYNKNGEKSLSLNFEKDLGPMEKRSALSYRCLPAVTENFKGKTALIAHADDYYRIEVAGRPKAGLYAIPFTKNLGKEPIFEQAIPLSFTDGQPFYAHSRTIINLYDWNKDGFEDIILSTENYPNKYNVGIELFLNDGNWNFTRTDDKEIKKLNQLMTAHHDIKLQFVNLSGSEEPDIVTWTDPGIRAYSRNFLRYDAADFQILSPAE